jgi:SAM-dependent methyltransferase
MRQELYQRLRCPRCRARLGLTLEAGTSDDVQAGWLDCWACVERYPIVGGIPRFVPVPNYVDTFGLLWDSFQQTVLDSALGVTQSHDRFFRETRWQPQDLQGKWLLEIGCGAGRFTEIAVHCGANVVAVDYSSAIDTCRRNLGDDPRLHYVQGDIYSLPLRPGLFDYVCCFGVLHRLPDAAAGFRELPKQLKPGGHLAVDIAPRRFFRRFGPTAWFRLLTTRLPSTHAMRLSRLLASGLLPLQRLLGRIPWLGLWLQRQFPIAPVETLQECRADQVRERACLAMCDRLMARHHQPGDVETVEQWLRDSALDQIETCCETLIVGRGRKPRGQMTQEPRAA